MRFSLIIDTFFINEGIGSFVIPDMLPLLVLIGFIYAPAARLLIPPAYLAEAFDELPQENWDTAADYITTFSDGF